MRLPFLRAHHIRVLVVVSTAFLISTAVWLPGFAYAQIAVRNQGYVPFSDAPINYRSNDLHDPVANLQKRLDAGKTALAFNDHQGYLKSVIEELNIPVSSQTLVFSKTSFQYKKITPQTPRALYFNDDVYVGFVHDGKALEVVSFDPVQGAIFYLLDSRKVEKPVFQRAELDCTQCHIAPATRDVPGVLLRSIFPSATGTQVMKTTSFVTSQDSPLKDRWGGWYVTGKSGRQQHMGNVIVQDRDHPELLDRTAGTNVTHLTGRFDKTIYLTADSDIVAHLVLGHQTQMHNLITETNYKTRIALYDEQHKSKDTTTPSAPATLSDDVRNQFEKPAEALVEYMLFTNEVALTGRIRGTSGFTKQFAALGPRDSRAVLCAILIYAPTFSSIPAAISSTRSHSMPFPNQPCSMSITACFKC
jgi:hypothetical protein